MGYRSEFPYQEGSGSGSSQCNGSKLSIVIFRYSSIVLFRVADPNFHIKRDPDPILHIDRDPGPILHNDRDPDPILHNDRDPDQVQAAFYIY